MTTQAKVTHDALYVELDSQRTIRHRNKLHYRFNHWPIWIFVFFIAPGPLTFDLFERGFDARLLAWLGVVLIGTGIAGLRGRLPDARPGRTYPLHRRQAQSALSAPLLHDGLGEVVAFAVLNTRAGLRLVTGEWRLKQMYEAAYFPIAGTIWALGAFGMLPRVKRSTKGEGHERRYFYGSVWAVAAAHPVLWLLWKVVPATRVATRSSSWPSSAFWCS